MLAERVGLPDLLYFRRFPFFRTQFSNPLKKASICSFITQIFQNTPFCHVMKLVGTELSKHKHYGHIEWILVEKAVCWSYILNQFPARHEKITLMIPLVQEADMLGSRLQQNSKWHSDCMRQMMREISKFQIKLPDQKGKKVLQKYRIEWS